MLERLKADPVDRDAAVDLHRHLHNLKGTGASFGFREFAEAVAQGERLVATVLEQPGEPPADWRERLVDFLDALDQAAVPVCSLEEADGCRDADGFTLLTDGRPGVPETGGRLVYICDDDGLTLEKLGSQLSCFGYETETFLTPESLYAAALGRRPDALVLDIRFPTGPTPASRCCPTCAGPSPGIPCRPSSSRPATTSPPAWSPCGPAATPISSSRPHISELVAALDQLTHQQKPRALPRPDRGRRDRGADYHALILQEAGMVTRQLDRPQRVLDVLGEFLPDMVLMDIYMPGCNGHDLAKVIRQVPNHVGLPTSTSPASRTAKNSFPPCAWGPRAF